MINAVVLLLAVLVTVPGAARLLPECPTEDSDNCVWIASDRGNGEGRSFVVVHGYVAYLD